MTGGMLATKRKIPVPAAAKILCASLMTALNQAIAISAPVMALKAAVPVVTTVNGVAQITGVWSFTMSAPAQALKLDVPLASTAIRMV